MDLPNRTAQLPPAKTFVWAGFALLAIATIVFYATVAGAMPASAAVGSFFSLIGRLIFAAGLLRVGLDDDGNPTLRAGALVAAALVLATTFKA